MRPSLVAAAIRFLPRYGNTTGDEANSCPEAEYLPVTESVFGSSANNSPLSVAAYTSPEGPNAGPTVPAIEPAGGCHFATVFVRMSRAQTALAPPAQFPVTTYATPSRTIRPRGFAFGGRKSIGGSGSIPFETYKE